MLMFPSLKVMLAALAGLGFVSYVYACNSYGVDFQHGGSYFQNSESTEDFTFVSQFEGCHDDYVYNILVDPSGSEYFCSDTNLQPDNENMMSTCPLTKQDLWSGFWSILLISDNGEGDPIAYERDFYLAVEPQQTTTHTPTVTEIVVVTPVDYVTVTEEIVETTALPPVTVVTPATTHTPTVTITPAPTTTTVTKNWVSLSFTTYTLDVSEAIDTVTASCSTPIRQSFPDPTCTITPTLVTAAALVEPTPTRGRRRGYRDMPARRLGPHFGPDRWNKSMERRELLDLEKRGGPHFGPNRWNKSMERRELLDLEKRAPDPQPLIVTETNPDLFHYVEETQYAPEITVESTAYVTRTETYIPPPVTIYNGTAYASTVTVTESTPTVTTTVSTAAVKWFTKTKTTTVSILSTTTPANVLERCKAVGGTLDS